MERISEVLFGLIMVLTITCSFSIAEAGRAEVRQMLIGALGCNIAWGIIDAAMYLMACFSERGRGILALGAVRAATNPERAHRIIAGAMPPLLAFVVSSAQFEEMRQKLNQMPMCRRARSSAKTIGLPASACFCWLSLRRFRSFCRSLLCKKRGSPCVYQTPSRSQCSLRWGMPLAVTPDIGR